MEHQRTEALTPTRAIAIRTQELRKLHGWNQTQLAEEMQKAGIPWERIVVTKLETGKRQSVSVDELLALARVLDVSVVDLLVPPSEGQKEGDARTAPEDLKPYQVTPTLTAERYMTRMFIVGHYPLYGMDAWMYYRQRPSNERMSGESLARTVRGHQLGRPVGPDDTLDGSDRGER